MDTDNRQDAGYSFILNPVVGRGEKMDSKKGVTGTNVAGAIFWWPGLAYTYYDAGEATRLDNDRKSALTTIYNNKNCTP